MLKQSRYFSMRHFALTILPSNVLIYMFTNFLLSSFLVEFLRSFGYCMIHTNQHDIK